MLTGVTLSGSYDGYEAPLAGLLDSSARPISSSIRKATLPEGLVSADTQRLVMNDRRDDRQFIYLFNN